MIEIEKIAQNALDLTLCGNGKFPGKKIDKDKLVKHIDSLKFKDDISIKLSAICFGNSY